MSGRRQRFGLAALLAVALLSPSAVLAQPEGPVPDPGRLRTALRELFESRLQEDLELSGKQVEALTPELHRFEDEGRRLRLEKGEIMLRLRRLLEEGGGGPADEELDRAVERLAAIEKEQFDLKQSILERSDRVLDAAQRAELRLFLEHFPRMVRDEVDRIRSRRPARGGRPFGRR